MNLSGDWLLHPKINGADVFCPVTQTVSDEWLSECKKERALTQELMNEVCDLSNFGTALTQVMKNSGSPGIDGMTTKELHLWFNKNYKSFLETILKGRYKPSAVRKVEIPKESGGIRTLGIPTVIDRLIQQAISQVLSKRYEPTFSDNSFGFRAKRGAHQALERVCDYVSEGYSMVVDIDLEKFFDKVNHDRLMWLLSRRISDKRLLRLINKFLKVGTMVDGLESQRIKGTPQGSPLSPILSNIILDELDKLLESRGHRFVRYADDIVLFVKSEQSAEKVLLKVTNLIENRLKLKVNASKSSVRNYYELNYLGYTLLRDGKLTVSKISLKRLKSKLKMITSRSRGVSLEQIINEVNPILRGWINYFRLAKMKGKVQRIEATLRRRLRCYRIKQCKRAKAMLKFFMRQGLPKWRAMILAGSRKGWMKKSLSPQACESMNNKWFLEKGLLPISEYYRLNFRGTAQYESTLSGVRGQVGN